MNIKKILLSILILFFGLFVISCNEQEPKKDNEEIIPESQCEHDFLELIKEVLPTYESDGLKAHYYCQECEKYLDTSLNEVDYNDLIIPKLVKELQEYTITYDLDGGVCNKLITSFKEDEKVTLYTPTKDGYDFIGWYEGENKITKIENRNYNLVAKWTESIIEDDSLVITSEIENLYVGYDTYLTVDGYSDLSLFDIIISNEDIIQMDDEYYFKGLKAGYAQIIFVLKTDPSIQGAITLHVLNKVPDIRLVEDSVILNKEFNLRVVNYSDVSVFDITYDNEYVAYEDGKFKALKTGVTKIKYSVKDDASTYKEIEITIFDAKPIIELDKILTVGETTRIDIPNYNEKEYVVEAEEDGFVSINNRLITGIKRGTVTLKVSLISDPNIFSTFDLVVSPITPKLSLSNTDIPINGVSRIFIDNLDMLEDDELENYEVEIDNDKISINDFIIKGLKLGTSTITITNKNDEELTSKISINVIDDPGVYDVDGEICSGTLYLYIDQDNFNGYIHAGEMLYIKINGAKSTENFIWSSSNSDVLDVFSDGRMIAIGAGDAYVTCYRGDNRDALGRIHLKIYGEPDVDYIGRLIAIAETQLGYREGPDNDTKYGDWYGIPNGAWCAMYVSWCANQAGISTSVIPKYASCSAGREWFESRGLFKYKESYVPKAGDIIFFLSDGASHTGIVINCDGKKVYTIEGNTSDMCAKRSYDLMNSRITGYGTPQYPEYSGTVSGGDISGSTDGSQESTK